MAERVRSARSSSVSTTVTCSPARAHTSAIPDPINPPPTTLTRTTTSCDLEMATLSTMTLAPLIDGHGRLIQDPRVSVTDRCNFRCQYCMPAEGLPWLDRSEVLAFEEIERVVGLLAQMGVRAVRPPGGEPLVRRQFPTLVAKLALLDGLEDLSLTTNGY